jgi:hypothetical protein
MPAGIGTDTDLRKALSEYRKVGLGGMELTVIYGVRGYESQFTGYLSPEWMNKFRYILKLSDSLGLGLDFANSSSWPFGGPWVTEKDAAKYVAYKSFQVKGGESLYDAIEYIQEPSVRWSGTYRADISSIKEPIVANQNLQELSVDQIRYKKSLPLLTLMAYSDKGDIIDLTLKINREKRLEWTAPPGNWTLYAVFQGWHGKMVERAGPGGEGYVIDHFSSEALKNYLSPFDKAFRSTDLKGLRAYFNDSYEVDDARGQSDWTPLLFDEFRVRRGYDLKMNLPALLQKDTPDKNARILSDYRQTISDLILDNFTKGWTAWANKQGKITRNQAHGSPANILDLYAASDIPETEGTDYFRAKFATSAANVAGKKLVSAEAATWLGEHFSSTLADVKENADNYFIAGVNHIFYHGTCFSPSGIEWPGFQFYAAVEFSPANPIWNDLGILNKYISRVQSFMQNSRPDNDVLLYFPVFDRYSDYKNTLIEHFDAISPGFADSEFKKAADFMYNKGYGFDYISDSQLENLLFSENKIYSGGSAWSTVLLPHCKYIPVGSFNRIINLADKGATIILYGKMPDDVSGWARLEENRELYSFLKEGLQFGNPDKNGIRTARYGKGKILMGENLEALLSSTPASRESIADKGLKFVRKSSYGSRYYFIKNSSGKLFDGLAELNTTAKTVALFNPLTGMKGILKAEVKGSQTQVRLTLKPGESVVVAAYSTKQSGEPYRIYSAAANPQPIKGEWTVSFQNGGPVIPKKTVVTELKSWTLFSGEGYSDFSGTGEYRITFKKPDAKADAWRINLGTVHSSARVWLNGVEIAGLLGPDFSFIADKQAVKDLNQLSVRVNNLAANRIASLDRKGQNYRIFYNVNYPSRLPENRKNGLFSAAAWRPYDAGILGPVTITPLNEDTN